MGSLPRRVEDRRMTRARSAVGRAACAAALAVAAALYACG
jgi:hypothetical protein